MDRISFDIYIPDQKKFHVTPNIIVYGLWFLFGGLFWLFNDFVQAHATFRLIVILIVALISLYYIVASYFTYQPLDGIIKGKIIFNDDTIVIDDKEFPLSGISDLNSGFSDYFGEMTTGLRGNFNGALSQGVGNFVEFKNSSGQVVYVLFRVQGKHGEQALYPFINQAVKVGAMSYYRAIDLIGVDHVVKPNS